VDNTGPRAAPPDSVDPAVLLEVLLVATPVVTTPEVVVATPVEGGATQAAVGISWACGQWVAAGPGKPAAPT
jgi:hypothetical protein